MSTSSNFDQRLERSTKVDHRLAEEITELCQVANNRNHCAISKAAQKVAKLNSRNNESPLIAEESAICTPSRESSAKTNSAHESMQNTNLSTPDDAVKPRKKATLAKQIKRKKSSVETSQSNLEKTETISSVAVSSTHSSDSSNMSITRTLDDQNLNTLQSYGYVPDDLRAKINRADVDKEIAKYSLVKLASDDTNITLQADEDDKVIFIPANIDQFKKLYGKNLEQFKTSLKKIDRYVRLLEDRFVGKRYPKNPVFTNKTIEAEEAYLGNAFHTNQLKQHTILELLQVLYSQDPNNPLTIETANETGQVEFTRYTRARLRHILFNNPYVGSISANNSLLEDEKWDAWRDQFNALNKDEKVQPITEKTTDQYKKDFGSFENFEKAINLMRSWLIDHDTKRQWTTMFLFPFGQNALYKEIDKAYDTHHNLFSGQGELIFSMLQRALNSPYLTKTEVEHQLEDKHVQNIAIHGQKAEETLVSKDTDVGQKLINRFFNEDDAINTFAGYINASSPDESPKNNKEPYALSAFLPYLDLPVYEKVKEDFNNLLYCNLNKQHLFIALARMATLNLLVYVLEQEQKMCIANEIHRRFTPQTNGNTSVLGIDAIKLHDAISIGTQDSELSKKLDNEIDALNKQFDINIPVCAKGKQESKDVKRYSKERQQLHHSFFDLSRISYVRQRAESYLALTVPFLRNDSDLSKDDIDIVRDIVFSAFNYRPDIDKKYDTKGAIKNRATWDARDCTTIIEKMVNKTVGRDTHMTGLITHLAAQCGLSKLTKSVRTNYEMTDELLRTLVMAVLGKEECMKLSNFLEIIRERYHIVIGPSEKRSVVSREELESSSNTPDLNGNLVQLKLQLHRLDMLIYLSDYCEYVKRP